MNLVKTAAVAMCCQLLLTGIALAQEASAPRFQIAFDVSTQDDEARERIEMYLRNELRALGDVEIAAENPDYKLYVVLTEMRAGGGRVAYVLTISVASFFPDGYFETILNPALINTDEVVARLEEVPVYERQFVSLAGPKEAHLIQTVTSSIANVNKWILEPKR